MDLPERRGDVAGVQAARQDQRFAAFGGNPGPVETLAGAAHFVAAMAVQQEARRRGESSFVIPHVGVGAHRYGFEVRQAKRGAVTGVLGAVELQQGQRDFG